jgi:hypothetical protein
MIAKCCVRYPTLFGRRSVEAGCLSNAVKRDALQLQPTSLVPASPLSEQPPPSFIWSTDAASGGALTPLAIERLQRVDDFVIADDGAGSRFAQRRIRPDRAGVGRHEASTERFSDTVMSGSRTTSNGWRKTWTGEEVGRGRTASSCLESSVP